VKRQPASLVARSLSLIPLLLGISLSAPAQQFIGAKAGIVTYARGEVFLNVNSFRKPPSGYVQLENNQTLSTKSGRAELLLASSAYLRLDENSLLVMEQNSLDGTQLKIKGGSALIEIVEKIRVNPISIHLSTSVIEIKESGLYRIDSDPPQFRVYAGDAVVFNAMKKIRIKKGKSIYLDGDLAQDKFDMEVADSLHQWAARRSFDVFIGNPKNRKIGNWEPIFTPIGTAVLKNPNYRMSFYSNASWVISWRIKDLQNESRERAKQESIINEQLERARREAQMIENARNQELAKH
jgi:hypothetical protein